MSEVFILVMYLVMFNAAFQLSCIVCNGRYIQHHDNNTVFEYYHT